MIQWDGEAMIWWSRSSISDLLKMVFYLTFFPKLSTGSWRIAPRRKQSTGRRSSIGIQLLVCRFLEVLEMRNRGARRTVWNCSSTLRSQRYMLSHRMTFWQRRRTPPTLFVLSSRSTWRICDRLLERKSRRDSHFSATSTPSPLHPTDEAPLSTLHLKSLERGNLGNREGREQTGKR